MGCLKSKPKAIKEPVQLPSDIDEHPVSVNVLYKDTRQQEEFERRLMTLEEE